MIDYFEQQLQIKNSTSLGTYLGFPLQTRKPSRANLSLIIDKLSAKLASWKSNSLSKAGRALLIHSSLMAIPRYYMQEIHCPAAILEKIDSVCLNFFWGGNGGKRKMFRVAWKSLCRPKDLGGLGFSTGKEVNNIALAKLCWNLENKDTIASS